MCQLLRQFKKKMRAKHDIETYKILIVSYFPVLKRLTLKSPFQDTVYFEGKINEIEKIYECGYIKMKSSLIVDDNWVEIGLHSYLNLMNANITREIKPLNKIVKQILTEETPLIFEAIVPENSLFTIDLDEKTIASTRLWINPVFYALKYNGKNSVEICRVGIFELIDLLETEQERENEHDDNNSKQSE